MDINTNLSSTSLNPVGPNIRSAEVATENTRPAEIGQSSQARSSGEDTVELSALATELAGEARQAEEAAASATADDIQTTVAAQTTARTGEPEASGPDPSSVGAQSEGVGSTLDLLV